METHMLMVSTYPQKGEKYSHQRSALAAFSKNTLEGLAATGSVIETVVLADERSGVEQDYVEDGVRVIGCWKHGQLSSFGRLLREIWRNPAKIVLVNFEWSLFGSQRWLVVVLWMVLLTARLLSKKAIVVSHGVLTDVQMLNGSYDLQKNGRWLNLALKVFYWMTGILSNRLVVLEQALKERLIEVGISEKKVVVIPHGVDVQARAITKQQARKDLGIKPEAKVVLDLGFLAWYKGTDWFAETMNRYLSAGSREDVLAVIAGGESRNYAQEESYQAFVHDIRTLCDQQKQLKMTGFLSETDLEKYVAACDVMVLPYRVFLSSSGPLSWAFAYGKPVLLAEPLKAYFDTQDMQEALKETDLLADEMVFDSTSDALMILLDKVWSSSDYREKLTHFSRVMREKRDWKQVGFDYRDLILNGR